MEHQEAENEDFLHLPFFAFRCGEKAAEAAGIFARCMDPLPVEPYEEWYPR